jgi:hypothetical protein
MMRWIVLFMALAGVGFHSFGRPDGVDTLTKHTASFEHFIKSGTFEFHARSFYMQTQNKGPLTDYQTLASGAGIAYYSPLYHHFSFGFSGFFVFRLWEHNLSTSDPSTQNMNRYEIALYDMNAFDNKKDLDRLEELFVKFSKGSSRIIFGRQKFNSPFLNEQDNRMRPNLFHGLKSEWSKHNFKVQAAWFTAVSMRGTVDWYTIEDSYGVYPFGRNPLGFASSYKGATASKGVGVLGLSFKQSPKRVFHFWQYVNENVFALSYLEAKHSISYTKSKLVVGAQSFFQHEIGNGGNVDKQKAYILPHEKTYGVGSSIQWSNGKNQLSLNQLSINGKGRFLFPREWGREQFFVSLPRERLEGSGHVNALSTTFKRTSQDTSFRFNVGLGWVNHPHPDDYQRNKYGVPSYIHYVAGIEKDFTGYWNGLSLRFLLVHKAALNPDSIEDKYRINRVDLWHLNLILDYRL